MAPGLMARSLFNWSPLWRSRASRTLWPMGRKKTNRPSRKKKQKSIDGCLALLPRQDLSSEKKQTNKWSGTDERYGDDEADDRADDGADGIFECPAIPSLEKSSWMPCTDSLSPGAPWNAAAERARDKLVSAFRSKHRMSTVSGPVPPCP